MQAQVICPRSDRSAHQLRPHVHWIKCCSLPACTGAAPIANQDEQACMPTLDRIWDASWRGASAEMHAGSDSSWGSFLQVESRMVVQQHSLGVRLVQTRFGRR